MKKLIALSAVALLSTSALAATEQTVTINGEVYDQTCQIDDSHNYIVTLPKIKKSDLVAGGTNNATEFSIKLKDCDSRSSEKVLVAFDHNSNNINTNGNLDNKATGNAATGVQIKITQENGTKINLKSPTEVKATPVAQSSSGNEFKFKAAYEIEAGTPATTGQVTTSIPVKIEYQ